MARQSARASVEVFYDGDCPVCSREARALRRMDRGGRLLLTDICSQDFDPSRVGIAREQLMDRIHARLANGEVIQGVEVFRRVYGMLGFGWVVPLTELPGMRQILELAYGVFAR